MIAKVSPPTKALERGIPKRLINTPSPKSPNKILGILARLLIHTSIKCVRIFCGANSSK